ncbi:MAG TPA: O-antigen ligase family protein, partial [Cyclobacteriaceae bacterium]
YDQEQGRLKKLLFEGVLLVGILLTFSRASFVAFGLTAAFMVLMNSRRIKLSYVVNGVLFCLIMIVIFYDTVIGQILTFFTEYLLSFRNYDLSARATSEGYRVYVFKQIFGYVIAHPLFGSSFAGLYLIFPEYAATGASSHGQYNDMLLRTGFLGLAMYLYVLYYLLKDFARTNKGLFYGLVGIVIYGFFHETFKLGHASLIFGFMLGYYLTQRESVKRLPVARDE